MGKQPKKLYTPELAAEFAERQKAGETQEEIASSRGVSKAFVCTSIQKAGLSGAWRISQKIRFGKIHEEYEAGSSITSLAKKYRISRQRVYQGFSTYQFKLRPWFER